MAPSTDRLGRNLLKQIGWLRFVLQRDRRALADQAYDRLNRIRYDSSRC